MNYVVIMAALSEGQVLATPFECQSTERGTGRIGHTQPFRPSLQNHVLLVEPDDYFRSMAENSFRQHGFIVESCAAMIDGLELLFRFRFQLVVTELRLQPGCGLSLAALAKSKYATANAVIVTSYASIATATKAAALGLDGYFRKPIQVETILRALTHQDHQNEGNTPPVMSLEKALWEYINRVVESRGNLAISGRVLGVDRRSLRRMLQKYPPPE